MKTITKLGTLAVLLCPAIATADVGETLVQYGTSVSVGGGFVQFVDSSTRDFATEGAGWEGRVAFGTKTHLAIEAGYLGTLHAIDALGLDSNANLLGTNVEGALRLNILTGKIQPYLIGGAGFAHYNLTNVSTNTSDVSDRDNIGEFPFGVGVAYTAGSMMFDARAVYRTTTDVDMFAGSTTNSLDAWSATLRLGFEY